MHAYHCINEDFKYGVLPLVLDYQPDHRDHDDKSSFSSQRLLIHIDFALFVRNKYYVIDVSKGGNTKSTPVYQCEDAEPVKEATLKLNVSCVETMHSNVKFVLYHTLRSAFRIEEGSQDAIVEEIIDAVSNIIGNSGSKKGSNIMLGLRVVMRRDLRESEVCPICMEEFVVGSEDVTCMPCSHVFHETCIGVWLDGDKPNCPVCRFEMPVVDE
ncbi:hypothetical protein Pyn_38827 [Prunus yedoensis var. nudiflora]|uniref:RING-type E3 ubiquitin transferase n=1 Tax=Prunus yedoensis var. nudiflora TaxID=2094558 RepID=A0A314Z3U2_PRUYE|nr:hypothetical protein Pyn_38827 [Prunus yedoensis var. nudiflora]